MRLPLGSVEVEVLVIVTGATKPGVVEVDDGVDVGVGVGVGLTRSVSPGAVVVTVTGFGVIGSGD